MKNIKNKIIFIIIFIAVSSAGMALLIFLIQKGSPNTPIAGLEPELIDLIDEPLLEDETEQTIAQPEKETSLPSLLDTDYFNLLFPPGWEKKSGPDTLPIIIVNSPEEITNSKAKEIDFQTNLSINRAILGEVSFKDYIESVKVGLIQTIPIIEIVKEEEIAISDRGGYFLEIKSIQQDLKFSTLIFFIVGKENTVWAFSFNTLEESYPDYKDIFNQIVKEIKMK